MIIMIANRVIIAWAFIADIGRLSLLLTHYLYWSKTKPKPEQNITRTNQKEHNKKMREI